MTTVKPTGIPSKSVLTEDLIEEHGGDVEAALNAQREKAQEHLRKTGSLPIDWWDMRLAVFRNRGRPPKYESVDKYLEKGREYFKLVASEERIPLLTELAGWMGFTSVSQLHKQAKRNPEFRDAHSLLLNLLMMPLEEALNYKGSNTTGTLFRLKNIPDGWEATEPGDAPLRYSWKDRKHNEVVGLDGAPLGVTVTDVPPEELYQEMLRQGKRLEPEPEPEKEKSGESDA